MIIAAMGQQIPGLKDTRLRSPSLLYFLRYKPRLAPYHRA